MKIAIQYENRLIRKDEKMYKKIKIGETNEQK
jgi:hypothetical protein